jgi:hypothetical protein
MDTGGMDTGGMDTGGEVVGGTVVGGTVVGGTTIGGTTIGGITVVGGSFVGGTIEGSGEMTDGGGFVAGGRLDVVTGLSVWGGLDVVIGTSLFVWPPVLIAKGSVALVLSTVGAICLGAALVTSGLEATAIEALEAVGSFGCTEDETPLAVSGLIAEGMAVRTQKLKIYWRGN